MRILISSTISIGSSYTTYLQMLEYIQVNYPDIQTYCVKLKWNNRNNVVCQNKMLAKIKKLIIKEKITHMLCIFEEVYFISKIKDWIEQHCKILINTRELYDTLDNKYNGYNFNIKNNIPTIPTMLLNNNTTKEELEKFIDGKYPLFLKNVYGCGGLGTSTCSNIDNLFENDKLKNIHIGNIVQPCIIGTIYVVDAVYDNGILKDIFILKSSSCLKDKHTVRMQPYREVVKKNIFDNIITKIGTITGYTGILNIDFLVNNDMIYLIEYNPRFGGTIICAIENKASIIKNYMNILLGLPTEKHYSRYSVYSYNQVQYFLRQLYQNPEAFIGVSWIKKYIKMKKKCETITYSNSTGDFEYFF